MTMLNGDTKLTRATITMEGVERAIQTKKGSVTAIAEEMGVSEQTVYRFRSEGLLTLRHAMQLQIITNGKVKAEEVCRSEDIDIVLATRDVDVKIYRRSNYEKCKGKSKSK